MPVFRDIVLTLLFASALTAPETSQARDLAPGRDPCLLIGQEEERSQASDEPQQTIHEVCRAEEIARDQYMYSLELERERRTLYRAAVLRLALYDAGYAPFVDAGDALAYEIIQELVLEIRQKEALDFIQDHSGVEGNVQNALRSARANEWGKAAGFYRDLAIAAPDDLKVQVLFLNACFLAGDDCPSLFPDWRERFPEVSCEDAIERVGILRPDARFYHPSPPEARPEVLRGETLAEIEYTSWLVSALMNVNGLLALQQQRFPQIASVEIVVSYTVANCREDTEMGVFFRFGVGAPGQTYHDLMRPVMRDNLLDVAWRVLDYELPQD